MLRTVSGGTARRLVQSAVVLVVLAASSAAALIGLTLYTTANVGFEAGCATVRCADLQVTVNAAKVTTAELAKTAHLPGVTHAARPYPETTITVVTNVVARKAPTGYLIRRVERVDEIVEDLFWRAYSHPSNSQEWTVNPVVDATEGWVAERNRLGVALVGVTEMLPKCAEILNAASPQMAFQVATAARQEVLIRLTEMHRELLTYQRAVRADVLPLSGNTGPCARRPGSAAWKVGLRSGSACLSAGEPLHRAVRK